MNYQNAYVYNIDEHNTGKGIAVLPTHKRNSCWINRRNKKERKVSENEYRVEDKTRKTAERAFRRISARP